MNSKCFPLNSANCFLNVPVSFYVLCDFSIINNMYFLFILFILTMGLMTKCNVEGIIHLDDPIKNYHSTLRVP